MDIGKAHSFQLFYDVFAEKYINETTGLVKEEFLLQCYRLHTGLSTDFEDPELVQFQYDPNRIPDETCEPLEAAIEEVRSDQNGENEEVSAQVEHDLDASNEVEEDENSRLVHSNNQSGKTDEEVL